MSCVVDVLRLLTTVFVEALLLSVTQLEVSETWELFSSSSNRTVFRRYPRLSSSSRAFTSASSNPVFTCFVGALKAYWFPCSLDSVSNLVRRDWIRGSFLRASSCGHFSVSLSKNKFIVLHSSFSMRGMSRFLPSLWHQMKAFTHHSSLHLLCSYV